MTYGLRLAARAALQVLLVSAQSVTIAAYERQDGPWRLCAAVGIAYAISWVWWSNARAATLSGVPGGRYWYAAGAAAGTLAGVGLMARLVG